MQYLTDTKKSRSTNEMR